LILIITLNNSIRSYRYSFPNKFEPMSECHIILRR